LGCEWVASICCALVGVDTPPDRAILVDVMGWQNKHDLSARGCMSALLDSGTISVSSYGFVYLAKGTRLLVECAEVVTGWAAAVMPHLRQHVRLLR
jgi:hypothetical protein